MLPRGAKALLSARMGGLAPAGGVVVSYVGQTPINAWHVHADSGKTYDWRFLARLRVAVVVRPGIDAIGALRAILGLTDPFIGYPVLLDCEREQMAYVWDRPNGEPELIQVKRGSAAWSEFFPWN